MRVSSVDADEAALSLIRRRIHSPKFSGQAGRAGGVAAGAAARG